MSIELSLDQQRFSAEPGENLLDALNRQGAAIPFSCRAGQCYACLVQCVQGRPDCPPPPGLAEGWYPACQCRVREPLQLRRGELAGQSLGVQVQALDWLPGELLRLRLQTERPLRYSAGQHLLLWAEEHLARPYSLASLAGEDDFLELHIAGHRPGAFADRLRQWQVGDRLRISQLRSGALHYDRQWQQQPLYLLASGSGLAPLWAVLREALRAGHSGPVVLYHLARDRHSHYLAEPLAELAQRAGNLEVHLPCTAELPSVLAQLRLVPRQAQVLVCGAAESLEPLCRTLFMAGLPRQQLLVETFTRREHR